MVKAIGHVLYCVMCDVAACIHVYLCIYLMENNSVAELPSSLTESWTITRVNASYVLSMQ